MRSCACGEDARVACVHIIAGQLRLSALQRVLGGRCFPAGTAVAFTFAVNIGVTLGMFIVFSYLRRTPFARRFYSPLR